MAYRDGRENDGREVDDIILDAAPNDAMVKAGKNGVVGLRFRFEWRGDSSRTYVDQYDAGGRTVEIYNAAFLPSIRFKPDEPSES